MTQSLCAVVLWLTASQAITVNIVHNGVSLSPGYSACTGDVVQVSIQGSHNIVQTTDSTCPSTVIRSFSDLLPNGTVVTFYNDELTAAPGQTKYFQCSLHCSGNRFSVSCPDLSVPFLAPPSPPFTLPPTCQPLPSAPSHSPSPAPPLSQQPPSSPDPTAYMWTAILLCVGAGLLLVGLCSFARDRMYLRSEDTSTNITNLVQERQTRPSSTIEVTY